MAGLAALPSTLQGYADARSGRAALTEAAAAIRAQDASAARDAVDRAQVTFGRARGNLGSPWTLPARLVPGLGRQLRAARDLGDVGVVAADAADGVVRALEAKPEGGWLSAPGTFDLAALEAAGDALEETLPAAERAAGRVREVPDTWLVGPLASARSEALEETETALRAVRGGAAGLSAAPPMLGRDEPRRYYVAFANLSELRGTGGFLGYFSVLEADGGRLRLLDAEGKPTRALPAPSEAALELPEWFREAYDRYEGADIWQNVNITTHFPLVGDLALQAIAPSELGRLDGVVQIDPPGLEPILEMTGPVDVEPWPEPITAGNVSEVTQHEAYVHFEDRGRERVEFLGRLVDDVFSELLETDVDLDPGTLEGLGDAAAGGHIQVFSDRPEEEDALRSAGLARGVDRARDATDVLSVVTENAGPNKIDWFLRREVRYEVTLDPEAREARGHLEAAVRNEAPARGLPRYVIGPNAGIEAGVNRMLVMLLRPPDDRLTGSTAAGARISLRRAREARLRSYHLGLDVPSGDERRVEAEFTVPDAVRREGDDLVYRLRVLRQPVAHPDRYEIEITAPDGWEVTGQTGYSGELTSDVVLEVRLSREPLWGLLR